LLFLLAAPVAGQERVTEDANKVKAAFLRNFAHYVTWPADAFPDTGSPWHVGVVGQDPFGDVLESTFKGRTEQARPFEVFRADSLDKLPKCQIVFVADANAAARRATLDKLKDKPVLTVGDAPDFLDEGGIVQLQVEDRVRMNINLDRARAASLTIQTKMLEVSHEVLENGVIRKVR
jgi:hypothetical protein